MRAKNELVDALPYIDGGYEEPGVRDAVLSMIEEETKRYKPTKNYLEFLGTATYNSFETDVMRHEFERIQNQKPMESLNMKRYELPPPPPNRLNDLNAWIESVNNSQAQLEHQANRILNLKLMSIYGSEAWKSYNSILESTVQNAQKELTQLRKKIQEVNYARKKSQIEAGQKLGHLETNWVGLVSKNYEIEQACVQLEEEINKIETHSKQSRRLSTTDENGELDEQKEHQTKRLRTESNVVETSSQSDDAVEEPSVPVIDSAAQIDQVKSDSISDEAFSN